MDCEACKAEIDNIKDHLKSAEQDKIQRSRDIWAEINKLKENHGTHDKTIHELAISIKFMSQSLTESIDRFGKLLVGHLTEEEENMKASLKAYQGIGWKIFSAIIVAGVLGQLGIKAIG